MKRTDPFYSSSVWKKCRQLILIRDHYLCQECLKRKVIKQADTVHHIVEYQKDKSLALVVDLQRHVICKVLCNNWDCTALLKMLPNRCCN